MNRPPERPPQRDSKSDLYEAALAAVKDREQRAVDQGRAQPPEKRRGRLWLLGFLGLVGLTLLILRPAWLVGPSRPPLEDPAVSAASLRLSLVRERTYVLEYLKQYGHLPPTLQDVGSTTPGILYQITGPDQFRLTGTAGDSSITLTSADSQQVFLGSSLRLIRNRGRQ